jgi:hypothetical protein
MALLLELTAPFRTHDTIAREKVYALRRIFHDGRTVFSAALCAPAYRKGRRQSWRPFRVRELSS